MDFVFRIQISFVTTQFSMKMYCRWKKIEDSFHSKKILDCFNLRICSRMKCSSFNKIINCCRFRIEDQPEIIILWKKLYLLTHIGAKIILMSTQLDHVSCCILRWLCCCCCCCCCCNNLYMHFKRFSPSEWIVPLSCSCMYVEEEGLVFP